MSVGKLMLKILCVPLNNTDVIAREKKSTIGLKVGRIRFFGAKQRPSIITQ